MCITKSFILWLGKLEISLWKLKNYTVLRPKQAIHLLFLFFNQGRKIILINRKLIVFTLVLLSPNEGRDFKLIVHSKTVGPYDFD